MTYEELLRRIVQLESSGNPMAQAKTTSAGGLYGFTSGTLAGVLKRMDPETYGGQSTADLAKLKFDPNISAAAAKYHLQNDIVPALQKADIPVSGATAYSGWFLGPQGAVKAYQADPSAKIADLFPDYIKPNAAMKFEGKPFAEWDVGTYQRWAATKAGTAPADVGGTEAATAAPVMASVAPRTQVASASNQTWEGFGQNLLGGLTGGLLGTSYVPSQMGIDTRKFAASAEPGFSGEAGKQLQTAATDYGFKDYAPSTGATASQLANLGAAGIALMAAGAPKQTWTPQAPAPVNRGRWRDDLFAGLLG